MSIEQEPALEIKIPEDIVGTVLDGLHFCVDEEGIEYLNGYALPPNNDEPWDNGNDRDNKTLTNAFIRSSNISAIVHGSGKPLFIRWDEIDVSALRKKPRHGIGERALTFLFGPRIISEE